MIQYFPVLHRGNITPFAANERAVWRVPTNKRPEVHSHIATITSGQSNKANKQLHYTHNKSKWLYLRIIYPLALQHVWILKLRQGQDSLLGMLEIGKTEEGIIASSLQSEFSSGQVIVGHAMPCRVTVSYKWAQIKFSFSAQKII